MSKTKIVGRPVVPAIRVTEDGLGPAMLALSPAMRAFVFAKVFYGMNNARAAEAAGYSAPNRETAKVQGYRLAHDDRVQAAIAEESRKLMRAEGPRSIRTLIEIRDNGKNEAKDRLKAAVELLNRCGLNAVAESHLTVTHEMSEAQLDRRILEMARELGVPDEAARKMLIAPDAIDAEFEDVTPAAPPTPEEIARQAERDRKNALRRELRNMTPEQREEYKRKQREQRSAVMKARYRDANQFDLEDAIAERAEPDDLSDLYA